MAEFDWLKYQTVSAAENWLRSVECAAELEQNGGELVIDFTL